MINRIWVNSLVTPEVELGAPIENGLQILNSLGSVVASREKKDLSYAVNTSAFEMALYEGNGLIKAVWFNDPSGRWWSVGRAQKLRLYLNRFGVFQDWELRIDDGWNQHYFNTVLGLVLVYGLHKDVIRINKTSLA